MTDNKITMDNKKIFIKPQTSKPTRPHIIINKRNNKVTWMKGEHREVMLKNFSLQNGLFKEDVIYQTTKGEFLSGNHQVSLVNRYNFITHSNRTVAKYTTEEGTVTEKSSDAIVKLVGQKNYDTIFSALCSVICQELKVRGILAMLSAKPDFANCGTQTEGPFKNLKGTVEKFCQTDENCMDVIYKLKKRRRLKRSQIAPYVVKDNSQKPNRVVIYPYVDPLHVIDDIKLINEDSNDGSVSNISLSGCSGISEILTHPEKFLNIPTKSLPEQTSNSRSLLMSQQQNNSMIEPLLPQSAYKFAIPMFDGSSIMVPVKPEDQFHIATPEILRTVSMNDRKRLLVCQAYFDWKLCLQRDEDGYLPIHRAVLTNDLDLLRRQCLVLKSRQESLDITADNQTALQMAIESESPDSCALLLQHGADPLLTDGDYRSAFHSAAERDKTLAVLLQHCRDHPREILEEHDLLKQHILTKTKEEMAQVLLDHACKMYDNPGYTPLMLASKFGNHVNAKLLLEASPTSINVAMPSCGDTALYLAISTACLDYTDSGNKSKVAEKYSKTITVLLSYGADPSIANHSGYNINDLLSEFHIADLTRLLAQNIAAGVTPDPNVDFSSYMFYKNDSGKVDIKNIGEKHRIKTSNPNLDAVKPVNTLKLIKLEKTTPNTQKEILTPKVIKLENMVDIKINTKLVKPKLEILENVRIDLPSSKRVDTKDLRSIRRNVNKDNLEKIVNFAVKATTSKGKSASDTKASSTIVSHEANAKSNAIKTEIISPEKQNSRTVLQPQKLAKRQVVILHETGPSGKVEQVTVKRRAALSESSSKKSKGKY